MDEEKLGWSGYPCLYTENHREDAEAHREFFDDSLCASVKRSVRLCVMMN
jgi:hypothetical protein